MLIYNYKIERGFNTMKRILAMLLAMMLIIALFAGCSNDAAKTDDTSSSSSSSSSETKKEEKKEDKKEEAPPADETIILTAFINSVGEFNPVNEVHQEFIKRTGIDVQYTYATTDDGQELTTMLASGDLPDFIRYNVTSAFRSSLWSQGFLAPLNELIDQYVPEMWNDVPENMDLFWTESDGNWYVIPQYYGDSERYASIEGLIGVEGGFSMRKDIYEALGSPSIATHDEYAEVLKTVKEQYGDEIDYPIYLEKVNSIAAINSGINIFVRSFGGQNHKTVKDDGTVYLNFKDDAYLEGMLFLNQLYRDGLLNPELFTADGDIKEITSDGAFFSYWGQGIAPWSHYAGDNNPYEIYEMPRAEGVEPMLKLGLSSIGRGNGYSITSTSENKEAAIKYLAYQMSHEGQMLGYHGIEGDHYELVEGYPKNSDEKTEAWNNDWSKMTNEMGIMGVDAWFPTLSTDGYYYYWLNGDLPHYSRQAEVNGKYVHDELMSDLAIVTSDTEEAVIETKIIEHWNNSMPTIILADSQDACIEAYNKFVSEVEAMGLEKLEAAYTEAVQGWLAKLGK